MIKNKITNKIIAFLFTVPLFWVFSCENMILDTEMNFNLYPSESLQLLKINESKEIELNQISINRSAKTVNWTADRGMIIGYGSHAIYTAPSEPCTTLVKAYIIDGYNESLV